MLAELLDLLSKRSDAWDRYNDAEREVNALYDANCGFREMNKAEDKQREAQKHFEHCCTQVGNFLDDGDVLDALRHHLVATLSPAVETTAERHYQPCEVCGVGHDESTPHKSYLRCALCNSPMPNPVPEVRSCCEAGAEFDRNGFAVNRKTAL
jgi:hypothetical protein